MSRQLSFHRHLLAFGDIASEHFLEIRLFSLNGLISNLHIFYFVSANRTMDGADSGEELTPPDQLNQSELSVTKKTFSKAKLGVIDDEREESDDETEDDAAIPASLDMHYENINLEHLGKRVSQRTIVYRKNPEKQSPILVLEMSDKEVNYETIAIRDLFFRILRATERMDLDAEILNQKASVRKTTLASMHTGKDAISKLQFRDIRRLEHQFSPQEEPIVLVRRHCTIISLDPLRVIVMADRVVFIVPDGADSIIELLRKHLQEWVSEKTLLNVPFEIRAYDAILSTVVEIQKQEIISISQNVSKVSNLFKKASILPVRAQEDMRSMKFMLSVRIERAKAHKAIILELLESDDVMALMNLSLLRRKPDLYRSPLVPEIITMHEDIEALLDSYVMDYTSLENQLHLFQKKLESVEDLVSLRLDTSRNRLLIANTILSVVGCTFAGGSFIGSLFGMNLNSKLEKAEGWFWSVVGITIFAMIVFTIGIIIYLRRAGVLPQNYTTPYKRIFNT